MTATDPPWLDVLIHEYLRAVKSLASRLAAEYGVPDLLTGRRSRAIPRTGETSGGIEFRFHGAGCWMSDGDTVVDIDFGPDGAIDVFDAWRLHVYSEDQPDLVGVRTPAEVDEALDALHRAGGLVEVERSKRFRLASATCEIRG